MGRRLSTMLAGSAFAAANAGPFTGMALLPPRSCLAQPSALNLPRAASRLRMQADPETMASFAPVLNLPATVVSLAIIGGAYVMRSRTEQAIAVRDKRLAAEKTLQQLKVKAVSGEAESGAVDAMQAEISGLQEEENSLLAVFGNKEIRLRIPPPPQDADAVARKRVEDARRGEASMDANGEERLPKWQEFLLALFTVGILSPFLFLAVADPLKSPSVTLMRQLAEDPNAPPPQALMREVGDFDEE